jgi:hypothetical protein
MSMTEKMPAEGKYRTHRFGGKIEPDPEYMKAYEDRLGGNEKLLELYRQAMILEIDEQSILGRTLMEQAYYLRQLKLYEKMLPWPEWVVANYDVSTVTEFKDGTLEINCRPKDEGKYGLLVMEQKGDTIRVTKVYPHWPVGEWLHQFTIIERITKVFRRLIPS